MKFEVTNPKAWNAVNEKNIPMKHKIKVYEKLGGAYRLGESGGEQVFNKMTELLKHRMGENDDNSSPEETLAGLKDMAMGNLERIADSLILLFFLILSSMLIIFLFKNHHHLILLSCSLFL